MSAKIRKLSCLAGVATVALAMPLTPGTAQAASWWSDPGTCTNVQTARDSQGDVTRGVSGRTVEIRVGTCGGVQHGWGRIRNFGSGDYIRFEVDTNGDRVPDGVSWYLASDRNYTAGYPTSSSSNRAFRACWTRSSTATCNSSNATRWW